MKRTLLLIVLFLSFTMARAISSQQKFDSVMTIMKDHSLPLIERYYMTGDIAVFSHPQKIEILRSLIPEAREYEDKAVITRLYAIVAYFLVRMEEMVTAKNYIDSAFVYKDQFDNNAITGILYYANGAYYHDMNDVKQAHENYYESVKCFKKLSTPPSLLVSVYFNLSQIYELWRDEERLSEMVNEMKEVPNYSAEEYLIYDLASANLFYLQAVKYEQTALLDSAIKYNLLSIDQYHKFTEEEKIISNTQLSQNYIGLAKAYLKKGDLGKAQESLDAAKKLFGPNRRLLLMDWNIVKADYLIAVKEYDAAEQLLIQSDELLGVLKEEQQIDYYHFYIDIYEKLGYVYETKRKYDKALEYEKRALEYRKLCFSKENVTIINDLRTQYNVDQKERIVNQLTLLSARRMNIIILTVAILVLCIVLIVQVIVRSRISRRANENKLKIEQMKRKESELEIELYKSRQEEKEREFVMMQNERQQYRMLSYLEGLEAACKRLSKELHDSISNELLALKMQMVKHGDSTGIVNRLEQIYAQVRAVSHNLIPPVFQHALFTEVLADYVYQWNELSTTQLILTFDPDDESWDQLPEEVSLGLYRIVQEAVGNALKYARATEIHIAFGWTIDVISLVIQDNGKGFDANRPTKGIGLQIINDRVESLHGQASIQTAPGEGTRIEIVIKAPDKNDQ